MAVHLERRGLTSLGRLQPASGVEVLCLQENDLQDFYGMPTFGQLKFLHVDGNRISSFLGMSHQPQLEILTAEGNPICNHPHFRLMALLACGESLRIINYRIVSEDERSICAALGGSGGWAARCICFGWTALELQEKADAEYETLFRSLKERYLARGRAVEPVSSFTGESLSMEQSMRSSAQVLDPAAYTEQPISQITPESFNQVARSKLKGDQRVSHTSSKQSYSAVEAARGYVEAYRRNGTIRGAAVRLNSPYSMQNQSALQKDHSDHKKIALQLHQSEVGCLGAIQLQNLEVLIEDEGVTRIPKAEVHIIGSTALLEVLEQGVLMFQTSLLSVDDIDLNRATQSITISGAQNEEAPHNARKSKLSLSNPESSQDSIIGVFKVLMLFKCTPSQLDRFYST